MILPAGTVTVLAADDAPVAVFDSAADALAAALDLGGGRRALHTGDARVRDDGRYLGPAVRTAKRLLEIANPGQALVSAATSSLLAPHLPEGASLADLGLHRLRDLSPPLRVFELRDEQGAAAPPLRSLDHIPNDLPVHLTGFVGREEEQAAVRALLQRERLVTLAGPGGSGKTRLAAQCAADLAERWPNGAWWIELGPVTASADVAEAVATAVGVLVEPVRGPLGALTGQLRDRRAIVCLDNCEHVLEGAAEVAEALLRSCPETTVLTTSREPLGLPGEAVWRVPPLAEEDAVALFVERAAAIRPWFTLDASSEPAVRATCSRLDRIPLALELAAAWLRTLTPRQIEAELDDRFTLLVRGPRVAVPRQQTLAASIEWSHALLEERDRVVLRRLAVFAGDFDLEAARSVGAADPVAREDVLDAVGRLVDKSLLVAEERAGEGVARYHLLETIREFAAGRLREADEEAATRDRHLAHFLELAETIESELYRDMDAGRTRLERDHDNLRAALEWGLQVPDPEPGRRLAAALPWLWHLHGSGHEGIRFLGRAVQRAPDDRSLLQARLLTGIALVADTASPLDLEFDAAQRALAIATEQGDDRLRSLSLTLAGVGQFYTDLDAAWELAAEALRMACATGEALVAGAALALQGIIRHLQDRHPEAEPLLETAVAGLLRHHRGIAATALGYRAEGALARGEADRARELAEQAVAVAAPLGDYLRVGSTRCVLALVHCRAGDPEASRRTVEPLLRLVEGAENDVFVPGLGRTMGALLLEEGDPEAAATWFEREARSTDRGLETWLAALAMPGLGAALRAAGRRGEAAAVLERSLVVARRLGMPGAVAAALEQQAHLAAEDDPERALDLHHEALALRAEHGLRPAAADSLEAVAALWARTGRKADAARVLAAAELDLDGAIASVRRGRGTRGRPSVGWDSLTPAEHDVVALVVDGLSNPDIGRRLFMSRGTVKSHLSRIYTKLDVANRTELAALATTRRTTSRS